ncbi:MAG: cation:proton antiporter [Candidatus Marsarchaeota archaeon]|nr:cation:proton antiporter [Candidatus Marsarchaeota archaeon]
MSFIIDLLLLFGVAVLLGRILESVRVPAIVGYIIAGVILGNVVLKVVQPTAILSAVAEVALFFIILQIGIEVTTDIITKDVKTSFALSSASFFIPVIVVFGISTYFFGMGYIEAATVSLAVCVPSISIISVLIMKYDLLRLEGGRIMLSSTVLNDIVAFTLLAMAIGRTVEGFYKVIIAVSAIYVLTLAGGRYLRQYSERVHSFFKRLRNMEGGENFALGIILMIGLLIAAIFQFIGITYVLGAFFAGILIEGALIGKRFYKRVIRTLNRLNEGFFIPVFFSIAGLDFILPAANTDAYALAIISVDAILAITLIYFIFEKRFKAISHRTLIGVMGGRGAVGITIGTVALESGLIGNVDYSVIILGTIVLSIIMPAIIDAHVKQRSRMRKATGAAVIDKL